MFASSSRSALALAGSRPLGIVPALDAIDQPADDVGWPTLVDPAALDEAVISWQASLFGLDDPSIDPSFRGIERTWLDHDCWVDHLPRWVVGADHVFAELVARLPWTQRRVPMYGKMLDEPRLSWWWSESSGEPAPLELLERVRAALSVRYDTDFSSIGCNLYRNGADSVAWHGDRIRHTTADSVVAIVSVGAPRPFLLRPIGGGASLSYLLGQGDLLVMGGNCQNAWQHAVPKVAAAGPRLSITYREAVDSTVVAYPIGGRAARLTGRERSADDPLTSAHPSIGWRAGSSHKGHRFRA